MPAPPNPDRAWLLPRSPFFACASPAGLAWACLVAAGGPGVGSLPWLAHPTKTLPVSFPQGYRPGPLLRSSHSSFPPTSHHIRLPPTQHIPPPPPIRPIRSSPARPASSTLLHTPIEANPHSNKDSIQTIFPHTFSRCSSFAARFRRRSAEPLPVVVSQSWFNTAKPGNPRHGPTTSSGGEFSSLPRSKLQRIPGASFSVCWMSRATLRRSPSSSS